MKKYGLQLRVPPSQQKKPLGRPPLPVALGFRDEEDDVEKEISRQASKNKALKDIEEQHKKALEEDPSVFDYDGVYDEMKQRTVGPRVQDREEKKPKYIHHLMKKAEERQREHDVIYERKLTKERSKDDHLFADKDKFITSAYKKKLAEQAMWVEEQRLRELREEKEDVTKKSDLSDFYFNLGKNVAFGAEELESRKANELRKSEQQVEKGKDTSDKGQLLNQSVTPQESSSLKDEVESESSAPSRRALPPLLDSKPVSGAASVEEKPSTVEQPTIDQPKHEHHKRSEDAVAAAKERFLARKRAKGL